MTDEQMDDLKQYVAAQISQSEARTKAELTDSLTSSLTASLTSSITASITASLTHSLGGRIDALRADMNAGFEAIAQIFNEVHKDIDNHEQRLTRLEQKIA